MALCCLILPHNGVMHTQPPPLISTIEAMKRLSFRSNDGVIAFLRRESVPEIRLGQRLFWRESDIEAILARNPTTTR